MFRNPLNVLGFFIVGCLLTFHPMVLSAKKKEPNPCNEAKRLIWEGLYHRVNQNEKEALYIEAIRVCPSFASAYNLLGAIYVRKGQLDKANEKFQEAIRLNPQFASPFYNQGVLYEMNGKRDAAIKSYEAALKISPTHPGAQQRIARLTGMPLKGGESTRLLYDRSLQQIERVAQQNPTSPDARLDLAEAYVSKGRIKDAIREYQSVIQFQPEHAMAHYKLAIVYLEHSRMLGGALLEHEALKKLDAELANRLERMLSGKQRDVQYLAGVKKMATDFFLRGEKAYEQSRYQEALDHLNVALLYEKDYEEARFLIGLVYTQLGKSQEALKEYQILMPLDKEKAEALYQHISKQKSQ